MGPPQMRQIAHLISRILHNVGDESVRDEVRAEVHDLCQRFPVPIVGARV
jgi:glycine/serine hydroxymethyltransferase